MGAVAVFAWAVPALFQGSAVDHTWVTTYDNRKTRYANIADIVAAGEHYWYCWGSFHPAGGTPKIADGFLGQGPADLGYAMCLCKPDVDSSADPLACGTIFTYGIDGVCHQLANQVLWSTDPTGTAPATVQLARGYWISHALFGPYGKQPRAWAQRLTTCQPVEGFDMNAARVQSAKDGFEEHLQTALKGRHAEAKIQSLLDRRRQLTAEVAKVQGDPARVGGVPSAADLNRLYASFLRDAAKILGDDDFERVFDQRPQDEMNVVDPAVYEAANRGTQQGH